MMLFFGVAGHTLFETTRDALFLEKVPTERLPWMYLLLAGLAFCYSFMPARNARKADPRVPFFRWAGAAALVSLAFAFLGSRAGIWGFYAMYLWSGFSGAILLSQGWLLVTRNVRGFHAKSDLATVGLGAVAGGGTGALVARFVVTRASGSTPLFFVCALFLAAVASAFPLRAEEEEVPLAEAEKSMQGASVLFKESYLRAVTLLGFLSFFALTLLDVSYKTEIGREVPEANRAAVLATVSLIGNILSLLLQLFVARVGLRFLGTVALAGTLPFFLTITSFGWALTETLRWGVTHGLYMLFLARIFDQGMRFSTQRTSSELLLLPIGDHLRARIKPILDVLLQRLAQATASVVALLAFYYRVENWSLIVVGAMFAWFISAIALRWPYRHVFSQALRGGILRSESVLAPFGKEGTATLVAALSSDNEAEVETALSLLREQRLGHLVPALILYHPNPKVVERGMAVLVAEQRRDAEVPLRYLVEKGASETRAAALRGLGSLGAPKEIFEPFLTSEDAELRATALAVLYSRGLFTQEEARSYIDEPREIETMRAMLRAIAASPSPVFVPFFPLMEEVAGAEIAPELVHAMAALKDPTFIPVLLQYVVPRASRAEARHALAQLGEPAQAAIEDRLFDPKTPRALLSHLPRTLARFGNERAVGMLLRVAEQHPEGLVRFKALRGLGFMLARQPRLKVPRVRLYRMLEKVIGELRNWIQLEQFLRATKPSEAFQVGLTHRLLVDYVADRRAQVLERLFRVLALRFPAEDFYRIHAGITSPDARLRRQSKELLETVLRGPVRVPTLSILAFLESELDEPLPRIRELLERVDALGSEIGREIVKRYRGLLPPEPEPEPRSTSVPSAVPRLIREPV